MWRITLCFSLKVGNPTRRPCAALPGLILPPFCRGVYKIIEWADIVNAHAVPGSGIIDGLKKEVHTWGTPTRPALLHPLPLESMRLLLGPAQPKQEVHTPAAPTKLWPGLGLQAGALTQGLFC